MTKREKIFWDRINWTELDVENCTRPDTCKCKEWLEESASPMTYSRYAGKPLGGSEEADMARDEEIIMMHMEYVYQDAKAAGTPID